MGMSAPELGAVTGATSDMIAEVKVRDWVHAQVALEVDRLREQGARAIVVGVNNMAIYRVRYMLLIIDYGTLCMLLEG